MNHTRESGRCASLDRGLEVLRAAYGDPEYDDDKGAIMTNTALFAAHFEDPDVGIDALRRALGHNRGMSVWQFVSMPLMRPIRAHDEFKALVREVGLDDYWREAGWSEHCRPLTGDDFECD